MIDDNAWPLVGRNDLLEVGAATLAGNGSVLFVGEAGVGKTALAARLADSFDPCEVTRIAATSLVGLPLRTLGARPDVDDDASGDRPIVVIDDVQLLDDDDAALLHRLLVERRIRLVATMRTGAAPPASITSLWKDELVDRRDLEPLGRDDVDRLIDLVLDGPIDPFVRRRLWELTLGSPLMLRELIRSTQRRGSLVRHDGLWRFTEAPSSARLDELIGGELDALEPDVRDVVDLVALGEPLGFDLLRHAATDDAIEAAERAGVVEIVWDDARRDVRMSHPMYGDVATRLMGEARAARICGRLLELLERTPMRRRDDIVRATTWQLRAGGTVVSDDMVLATRRALYDEKQRLAIEIATRAIKGEPDRTDVALLLAGALASVGEHARADEQLAANSESPSETELALVAMARAVVLFWGVGDGPGAEQVLDRALERLGPGPWRDEVRSERALIASNQGQLARATAIVDPIIARDSGDRVFVTAAISASCAWSLDGRCLDAIDLATRAFDACASLGRQPALTEPGIFVVSHVTALAEAGQLADAEAISRAARDLTVSEGKLEGQAWFSMLLARNLLISGRFGESVERFVESAASFAGIHSYGPRRWSLAGAVMASAMRGDAAAAHRFADELAAAGDHPAKLMEIEVERASAYLLALDGDTGAACRALRATIERHLADGALMLIGGLLHDIVRFGGAVEPDEWALLDRCQGELAPLRAELGAAIATGSAQRLGTCAERFAAMGAHLSAVEAALWAAARHRADGDERAAVRQQRLAEQWRAQIDPGPILTLDLIEAETPPVLTSREVEVARLAAIGRSNREIADALFVSVRTVENHLQRVYFKLGVTGRRNLADVVLPGGAHRRSDVSGG